MNAPAFALTVAAAAVLLLVGGVLAMRQREAYAYATQDPEEAPTWLDSVNVTMAGLGNAVLGSPVEDMQPSGELLGMLKKGEALRLLVYRLGDGGSTIGWGRYYKDNADGTNDAPAAISRETAEAWFLEDVEARAARWVRAYVAVPLLQHQFDALTHLAYNLKPSSFKTIADAVNRGEDPEAAALRFVRAGSGLEQGLRNRRAKEIALYRHGTYA
jgi:lysozyme